MVKLTVRSHQSAFASLDDQGPDRCWASSLINQTTFLGMAHIYTFLGMALRRLSTIDKRHPEESGLVYETTGHPAFFKTLEIIRNNNPTVQWKLETD